MTGMPRAPVDNPDDTLLLSTIMVREWIDWIDLQITYCSYSVYVIFRSNSVYESNPSKFFAGCPVIVNLI